MTNCLLTYAYPVIFVKFKATVLKIKIGFKNIFKHILKECFHNTSNLDYSVWIFSSLIAIGILLQAQTRPIPTSYGLAKKMRLMEFQSILHLLAPKEISLSSNNRLGEMEHD